MTEIGTFHGFVDRGDPVGWDFSITDFTLDDGWHDIDFSSIVPNGTKAVLLRVYFVGSIINTNFSFRKKGNLNAVNVSYNFIQVSGQCIPRDNVVFLGSDRKAQYLGSTIGITGIYIAVGGWWI